MILHILRVLCTLPILTSCVGQNTSTAHDSNSTVKLGTIVSEVSKDIWSVFQTSKGDYWFGSNTEGAYRFDGKTLTKFSVKDGLSSNSIRGIQEDRLGNIFFSTLEGINKFDGHNFTNLSPVKSNSPADNWKLQKDDLWFCILGKNGDKGPYRFDGENLYQLEFPKHYLADEFFKKFPHQTWNPYDVYYIYKDRKGTMWFGTSNLGICHYDGHSISWLYEDQLTNTPSGGSFGIRSILEDRHGKFWFCNSRYRFSIASENKTEDGKILTQYEKEKGIEGIITPDGADHIYFLSIVEDNNGDLWMVTYNEGVWRYNGKEVRHYAVKDGTKDITTFSIYKDRTGNLWLGTHENGVYKFNGKSFDKFIIN